MKVKRVIGIAILLGLLVSMGALADARTTTITRGNCKAMIGNGIGQDSFGYSYRISSGSTSCGYMSASVVVVVPGGSRQYIYPEYSYRYAIAQGWPKALYVYQSFHFLRDGAIPDPGYEYQLRGDW